MRFRTRRGSAALDPARDDPRVTAPASVYRGMLRNVIATVKRHGNNVRGSAIRPLLFQGGPGAHETPRRGLTGSEIKITLSPGRGPVIMRDAVGRSRQLRAGIRVVVATAVATVTSALIFASDTFFFVTRQSVPLEANSQLRFAEDEGYVRIG